MAFSNMQGDQKEAFFALLDEYFASRPAIFANLSSGPTAAQTPEREAVSAVHRAMMNNPEATSKVMSAGLRHLSNARTTPTAGVGGSEPSAGVSADNEATSVAGRVSAASSAFSAARNRLSTPGAAASPPPVAQKPASGLTQVKKIGHYDTSSTIGFLGSMRSKPASSQPLAIPSAFAPKANNFAPPPRRTGSSDAPAAKAPPPPALRQPTPEPEPEPEEEAPAGEWAEVLYDYSSGEASDLKITEGQQVLVVERTSDDWWTGELNGKKGLFPASYVKLVWLNR